MDKGKKVMSHQMNRRSNQLQMEEERRMKKKKEAEELETKRHYDKLHYRGTLRRLENRLAKKGKDWVETKEEHDDVYGFNLPLFNHYYNQEQKIEDDFRRKKITEEQRVDALQKTRAEYRIQKAGLDAIEDAEYEDFVEGAAGREGQIDKEERARIAREKEEIEIFDETYPAVDLSDDSFP